jgi:aldose 1-epimerase
MLTARKCPGFARWFGLCALLAAANGCASSVTESAPVAAAPVAKTASIQKEAWGEVDGKPITLFTLTNKNGLVLKVANYGGVITELDVPDRNGKLADVVLGFDNLASYVKKNPHFGAVIGRVANRIVGARFDLEGKTYKLAANDGKNSLHGGAKGWDKVVWEALAVETPTGPAVRLTYTSKDGEEGYPGTVTAVNTYTLTNKNELKVEMQATTDKETVVSMAHHSYWNLAGHASGTILDQEVRISADKYTPNDPATGTLGGEIAAVKGTPFDFTVAKPMGLDLKAAGGNPIGFDENWIVNGQPDELREALRVKDPKSGRVLTVSGDQPGVQFYTGNYLDGSDVGKGGARYAQYTGFCVETQKFPNSVNIPAWQPEVVLKPGQVYKSTMVHAFTTE